MEEREVCVLWDKQWQECCEAGKDPHTELDPKPPPWIMTRWKRMCENTWVDKDWACPNCMDIVFANNDKCRLCQEPTPAEPASLDPLPEGAWNEDVTGSDQEQLARAMEQQERGHGEEDRSQSPRSPRGRDEEEKRLEEGVYFSLNDPPKSRIVEQETNTSRGPDLTL